MDTTETELASLKKKRDEIREEINAEYWTFTRCARGKPPRRELYEQLKKVEQSIKELERS